MRPKNWDSLPSDEKMEIAHELLNTIRGRLVISQALEYGIRAMKAVDRPEHSNIADLEMLRETIFNLPVYMPDTMEIVVPGEEAT